MHCLMTQGIFADQATMIQELLDYDVSSYFVFIWFLVLGNLGALNLFIGVCVDVVNNVSDTEEKHRRDELAKLRTEELLREVAGDADDVTIYEFKELCESEHAHARLMALEIDVQDLWDLGGFIFFDTDEISHEALQKHILQLRGSNPCTVKDVVDTRKFFLEELDKRVPAARESCWFGNTNSDLGES